MRAAILCWPGLSLTELWKQVLDEDQKSRHKGIAPVNGLNHIELYWAVSRVLQMPVTRCAKQQRKQIWEWLESLAIQSPGLSPVGSRPKVPRDPQERPAPKWMASWSQNMWVAHHMLDYFQFVQGDSKPKDIFDIHCGAEEVVAFDLFCSEVLGHMFSEEDMPVCYKRGEMPNRVNPRGLLDGAKDPFVMVYRGRPSPEVDYTSGSGFLWSGSTTDIQPFIVGCCVWVPHCNLVLSSDDYHAIRQWKRPRWGYLG